MASKSSGVRLWTAERRAYVLERRKAGDRFDKIVQGAIEEFGLGKLPRGWDSRYAYKDVMREMKRMQDLRDEDVVAIREMELQRLDEMQAGLWDMAIKGDGAAVEHVLNIMKMRAKYLGLEVPAKVDITSGGGAIGISDDQRLRGLAALFTVVRAKMFGEDAEGNSLVDATERTTVAGVLVESG